MSALLELDRVTVSYGGLRALTDVSLVVPAGTVVALLGPNGAGKSTTLRTISGLIHPESGHIVFEGRRIEHDAPFRVARAGILPRRRMTGMRKWSLAAAGVASVLAVVAAAPVIAADNPPAGGSTGATHIAGYTIKTLSAAVRYQLNSPGLLPVGDPNEGNVMEADLPFARINISQGPVIDALGSP